MSAAIEKISLALEAAKLYIIRFPHNSGDEVIRCIDDARVHIIGIRSKEPQYDREGYELQACEGCGKPYRLEIMSSVEDDGWFCPKCMAAWQAEEKQPKG